MFEVDSGGLRVKVNKVLPIMSRNTLCNARQFQSKGPAHENISSAETFQIYPSNEINLVSLMHMAITNISCHTISSITHTIHKGNAWQTVCWPEVCRRHRTYARCQPCQPYNKYHDWSSYTVMVKHRHSLSTTKWQFHVNGLSPTHANWLTSVSYVWCTLGFIRLCVRLCVLTRWIWCKRYLAMPTK